MRKQRFHEWKGQNKKVFETSNEKIYKNKEIKENRQFNK